MNRVAIYASSGFRNEITGFYAMECVVTNSSRVIKAPVEGGSMSFDNKVVDPAVIKMVGKINLSEGTGQSDTGSILSMFRNRNFEFYSCTTKDSAYDNLILQNVQCKEEKESFDTTTYELEFVEALVIQGSRKSSLDKENDNYYAQGNKNPVKIA